MGYPCNHVFDWGNCTSSPPHLPPPIVPPYCGCSRPGATIPNTLDPSVGNAILSLQAALRAAFMGVSLKLLESCVRTSYTRTENDTDVDISNPKPGSQPFTLVKAEVQVIGNLNELAMRNIEDVAAFYVMEQLGGQIPNDKPVRYDLTLVYINPVPTP